MPKGKKRHRHEEDKAETLWPEDGLCPLCRRELIPGSTVNYHHLIPKSYGGRRRYAIHTVCHSKIHSILSESELAAVYNNFERLRSHGEIISFIHWIARKPATFTSRHAKTRDRL
jgi:hypothetical protein